MESSLEVMHALSYRLPSKKIKKGSNIGAHALLNVLNELRTRDRLKACVLKI